jgi:hypothetical protein
MCECLMIVLAFRYARRAVAAKVLGELVLDSVVAGNPSGCGGAWPGTAPGPRAHDITTPVRRLDALAPG